jgi:HAMP domain-containing protein
MGVKGMKWHNVIRESFSRFFWLLLSVPIYFKILGIGVLVAFLFGAVTLYQIQASLTRYLYKNLGQNTLSMAGSLSETLARPLIIDDIFSVHEIIRNNLESSTDIQYIIIQDVRGNVVAHTFVRRVPEDLLRVSLKDLPAQGKLQILQSPEALIFDATMPIQYGKAGTLRVGVSDERIREVMSSITQAFLWALALCVVIGQGLAILLTYILTRPINHLVMASNQIRKGDFQTRAAIFSSDEIGNLAMAFNQMAEGLQRYKEEVKKKESERVFLIKRIVTAQEEERKSIARELHDQLGSSL